MFSILLFSSTSLHCSLRKAYLSLLFSGTLHSVGYIFPFLLCLSLLSSAISSDSHFENPMNTIMFISSVQFSSVTQSCLTLFDPMNRSTPVLPVHHQLPEFIQTHVHRVGHAIQSSHPLSSPSPPAPNPSQHQGLF